MLSWLCIWLISFAPVQLVGCPVSSTSKLLISLTYLFYFIVLICWYSWCRPATITPNPEYFTSKPSREYSSYCAMQGTLPDEVSKNTIHYCKLFECSTHFLSQSGHEFLQKSSTRIILTSSPGFWSDHESWWQVHWEKDVIMCRDFHLSIQWSVQYMHR